MKAFNGRITTPTIGKYRLPLYTAMFWIIAGLAVVFTVATPMPFNVLLGALAFVCFFAGVFVYLIRDRLVFYAVHVDSFRDGRKRSVDVCEEL